MGYPCIGSDDCPVSVARQGAMCARHQSEDLAREEGLGPAQPEEAVERERPRRVPDTKKLLARTRRVLDEQLARLERETNKTTKTGRALPPSRGLLSMTVELTNSIARLAQETRQWMEDEREKGEALTFAEQIKTAMLFLADERVPEEDRRRAVRLILESLGEAHLTEVKETA